MQKISNSFCFQYENGNSKQRQLAHQYYKNNDPGSFDEWGYNDVIIVFDTNLLLNTYHLSKLEREAFVKFINQNKERIVIPSQVDVEYQNHRLEFLSGYNTKLANLEREMNSALDGIKGIILGQKVSDNIKRLECNHIFKYDFPSEVQIIEQLVKDYSALFDRVAIDRDKLLMNIDAFKARITEKIASFNLNSSDMYMEDELCKAISGCVFLDSFSKEETELIKQKYTECLNLFNQEKSDNIGCYKFAFPGCGDRNKEEDKGKCKESDMIIYHEILRYIESENKNVIFITLDTTKGDWVPSKKHNDVFLHYVENEFLLTGQVVYIKSGADLPLSLIPITEDVEDDSDSDEELMEISSEKNMVSGENGTQTDGLINQIVQIGENDIFSLASKEVINIPKGFGLISEERFMSELETCTKWAMEYGAGYVGRDYFIYALLGRKKHFLFDHTRKVYAALIEKKKIKEVKNEDGDEVIKILDAEKI